MLFKFDRHPFNSYGPTDLLNAGLNPLALLTMQSNVTVDKGVINRLIAEGKIRTYNESEYKPKSESVVKTKSKQVNTRSIPSSDPASEHVRDVPSENVISSADDSDKLTTWLEFHSTPKDRRGCGLYYPIVDDHDYDILAETRQRCIDNVAQRAASKKPNLAKAGKGYKRKGKQKKPKYQLSRGEVLNFSDPYVKEIWRRHLERLGVDRYIASAEAEHHEMQCLDQVQRLEAHIASEQAVTQAANDPDYTAEPATEYKMTPSGTESALLEQSVVDRDLVCNYTHQELMENYELRKYYNTLAAGLGSLYIERDVLKASRTHVKTTYLGKPYTMWSTAEFKPTPEVPDGIRYSQFLTKRTELDALNRDMDQIALEETDPLGNLRSSTEAGEFICLPIQVFGNNWAVFAHKRRAKAIQEGVIKPLGSFKAWSEYVERQLEVTQAIQLAKSSSDLPKIVRQWSVDNETYHAVLDDGCYVVYLDSPEFNEPIPVDGCQVGYSRGSFKAHVKTETLVLAARAAFDELRKDFTSFRKLSNNVEVQRRKSKNTFRVATTTDLNGTYMVTYQYPELDRSQGTFAMFDAIAKGIEERAGVSHEHVSDGSPDMTTSSSEFVGPPVNVKPTEVDSSPTEEVGGNVIPIQRARDWNRIKTDNLVAGISNSISNQLAILDMFEQMVPHEREEMLAELQRIVDEA